MTDNHAPQRKRPTSDVTRELFLYSGNQCAYRTCDEPLLNSQGSYVAQIAHIEGVGLTSARHNPSLSDDDLRAVTNLMLMCPNHHVQIDDKNRLDEFTVEALREMKAQHEAKFREAVTLMSADIGDLTDLEPVYPTSLHSFGIASEEEFHDEELATVHAFVDVLAKLPPAARQVLAIIVGQSQPSRTFWKHQLRVPAIAVEKSVTNVDRQTYGQLLHLLQDRDIVEWQEEDGAHVLWLDGRAKASGSDLDVLLELKDAFGHDAALLRRALVDLDFSILDEAAARALG